MKRMLLVACFSLIALVVAAPPANAGGRFFVGFGIGFGGGFYRSYFPVYPRVYPPYSYGCYPPYGCYRPYGYYSPFISVPPVRYYVAPVYTPYRAYTLRVPRSRFIVQRRDDRLQRNYARYVVRRYVGRR